MKSKVLIIDHENKPLSKIRRFFKRRQFEIIKPKETESIFNICKSEDISAVVIDTDVFGKRSRVFLQNLRDHILPPDVRLISIGNLEEQDSYSFRENSILA